MSVTTCLSRALRTAVPVIAATALVAACGSSTHTGPLGTYLTDKATVKGY